MILLNIAPRAGPKIAKAAMTTTETRTRINAYSTSPWAFLDVVHISILLGFTVARQTGKFKIGK